MRPVGGAHLTRSLDARLLASGLLGSLGVFGCVFHAPPPLPEELAAAAAQASSAPDEARDSGASQGEDPDAAEGFRRGDPPKLGMTREEIVAYNKAQGDPHPEGFPLEVATADLATVNAVEAGADGVPSPAPSPRKPGKAPQAAAGDAPPPARKDASVAGPADAPPPARKDASAASPADAPPTIPGDDVQATPELALWMTFETTQGDINCQLFEGQTPQTVANFVGLARGLRPFLDPENNTWRLGPYYTDTTFHRTIPGFMIQGGDPSGTGLGHPGYVLPDEIHPEVRFDRAGLLAMANRGPTSGGSQFFITLAPTPHLDGLHTIFGQCTPASVKVAEAIAAVPHATESGANTDRPEVEQTIDNIRVYRGPARFGFGSNDDTEAPSEATSQPPEAAPEE